MLHPKQFKVNEAWIAFKLNNEPIRTQQDGEFDFLALMNAASCFILGSLPVPLAQGEPTQLESQRLMQEAQAHKKRWPKKLFVPSEQPAQFLTAVAARLGIGVVRLAEKELSLFIGEAQDSFKELRATQ